MLAMGPEGDPVVRRVAARVEKSESWFEPHGRGRNGLEHRIADRARDCNAHLLWRHDADGIGKATG